MSKIRLQDCFWSSDYISGINRLFSMLEYSQGEVKIVLDMFRSYIDVFNIESTKLKALSIKASKSKQLPLPADSPQDSITFVSNFQETHPDSKTFICALQIAIQNIEKLSQDKEELSSFLLSNVVFVLQEFLDSMKSFNSNHKKKLTFQYQAYERSVRNALSTEKVYINKASSLEFLNTEDHSVSEKNLPPIPSAVGTDAELAQESMLMQDVANDEDQTFKFPLTLGTTAFQSAQELKVLLDKIMNEIPLKRRLIPIPGVNNNYFSSEDFFNWVKHNEPHETSRRSIEKFGQDLINLGMISNWNKLAQNVFVSEEDFYEFTDLARFAAKFDDQDEVRKQQTSQVKSLAGPHSQKKSNSVFESFKARLIGTGMDVDELREEVSKLETNYFHAVEQSNIEKEILERLIEKSCEQAETMLETKTKLLFNSSKIFNDRLIENLSRTRHILDSQTSDFVCNEENLELSLLKETLEFNSGWYWPKLEVNFRKYGNSSTRSSVELFGNDLLTQKTDPNNSDLKTKSVPFFIYAILNKLNTSENLKESWIKEIDLIAANKLKRKVQSSIPDYALHYQSSDKIESFDIFVIREAVEDIFKFSNSNEIISLLKVWLLDLPDSLLPFTSYDSLRLAYKNDQDEGSKIKILSTIPRQNLATTLQLFTHLSNTVCPTTDLLLLEKIPLYHLILRPSPKVINTDVNDIFIFNLLVKDLLDRRFQDQLYEKLEDLERLHLDRTKRADNSLLHFKKLPREETSISTAKTQNKQNLTVEGLRPFRTKSPASSPLGSPRNTLIGDKKAVNHTHSRSSSHSQANLLGTLLTSTPSKEPQEK